MLSVRNFNFFGTHGGSSMVPATANAGGGLDALPSSRVGTLRLRPTVADLETLLGGEEAIVVALSAGADCSDLGDYALPVQLAFRVDATGKPVARLPQFTLTGNLYQMFGADYRGTTAATSSRLGTDNWLSTWMTAN